MRHYLIILPFVILCSCKEIVFKEPQPQGVKSLGSVPSELHGKYLGIDDKSGQVEDTLIISKEGFRVIESKGDDVDDDQYYLSDSVVMKKYKGYYFVNTKNEIAWRTFVLSLDKNKDLTHRILMQKDSVEFNQFLFSLSREVTIDSTEYNDEMYYVVDPSPKVLMGLIEKGYFIDFKWKRAQ